MQFPGPAKPPVGIVFDSAMHRIDDALALAMLHGFDGKEQARIAAIAVSSGDLKAAQFCDTVRLFYASATTGPAAMFMHGMPIGLADGKPAAESPIFNKMFGKPGYATAIKSINDTADVATLIRNALMAQYDQNAAVVLSGPATDLAKLLDMYGVKDWIARKVRLLCVAETGIQADVAAAEKVFAEWPTPIVTAGREIGEALPFPAASIEKDFAWSGARHPVVDAYRAYQPMPYDAPSWAMAAMLYAVRPNDGYFKLSDGGKPRSLILDPEQKERIIRTYIEMASAKPVARKPRRPPDEKKNEKKEEETKKKEPAK
jgi:inosine-uridine nucleoside N-ribohydrolase